MEYEGVASVKVGAGMHWGEVCAEVLKHNLTVIGGSEHNVGIGGLIVAEATDRYLHTMAFRRTMSLRRR